MDLISRRAMLRTVLAGTAGVKLGVLPSSTAPLLASGHTTIVFPWLVPTDPASIASFHRHAGVITHVSPTWYAMQADLSITGHSSRSLIRFARARRIRLIPLIKNEGFSAAVAHEILATDESRTRAAVKIAALVLQSGVDGINLDFEGPFGASRQQYADLLARLARHLRPSGKLITVDVVPQLEPVTSYPLSSGAAPYDYGALGHTCDQVMLLCYSYSHRKPGSLAPLWWLRDATGQALTLIPARRLVVGIGFYGRHWIINGGQSTVRDLTQAQAEALLAGSGAQVERPAPDDTPRFSWQDTEGTHTVHYEDAFSLTAKLQVVRTAGVAGAAFWRLGQEDATQWDVIARSLRSGALQ
jgi:spore germination protein YaaH